MTTFPTIWPNALAGIFDVHGVAATYTPYGGTGVACTVIYVPSTSPQPGGFDAQAWAQGKVIHAKLAEIGGVEPNKQDTFLIGSTTYTVKKVVNNDGYSVELAVV